MPATMRKGVAMLGPSWPKLSALLALFMATTVVEGFGIGMLLPVAELLQVGGELSDAVRNQPHWRYLAAGADFLGVPLSLPTLLLASLALFTIRNALVYARSVLVAVAAQHFILDNRARGFWLFLQARNDYQDTMSIGRVVNDLNLQISTSSSAIFSLVSIAHIAFMAAYYFAFLFLLSWKMTLAILLVLGLAYFVVLPIARASHKVGETLVGANQAASAFLVERLGATRLIRLARSETAEVEEMRRRAKRQASGEIALIRNSARTALIIESFVAACVIALLHFGTTVLSLELATIGMTLAILIRQLPVVREFIIVRQAIVSNSPSVARVVDLFEEMERTAEPTTGERDDARLRDSIIFDNVTFRYSAGGDAALNGVSLVIPAGKMTALVGPSGGGKSTLIDMLPRLREPDSGEIRLDGTPIREFTHRSLRGIMSYAPQAPQIFNSTVAEHIRYGRPEASEDEIRTAAERAGARAFIEAWPEGFETMLGEKGVRLSGGQKQRIDLARALVGHADLLILDEPTSNIDSESEFHFQKAIQSLRGETGRTIVVVGHRLSTVRDADQIVVMDGGRVMDCGTHAELLERSGWYAAAFRMQVEGLTAESPFTQTEEKLAS